MKPINEMKLQILSKSCNESFARVAVASFAAQADPTVDKITDIKTAVSEAVTNCIVHAYKEKIGVIYITCKLYESGLLQIRVRDRGCGISDVLKAREPLFTTAPEDERAGLGFAVMESFMDKLRVTSRVNYGTTVVMEKQLLQRGIENGTNS